MWVSRPPGSGSLTLAVGQKASSRLYVQCAPLTLAQGAADIHMVLPCGGPSLLEESTPLVSFPGTPAPSAGFRAEEDKATQSHSGLVKTGRPAF